MSILAELGFEWKFTTAEYRAMTVCRGCGLDSWDETREMHTAYEERSCDFGNCWNYHCTACGFSDGGVGLIGCPCSRRIHSARRRRVERLKRIRARRALR